MPLTTPLPLARDDAPRTDWTINAKRVEEIHFFDPRIGADLFRYPYGCIALFHGEEVTAIDGVSAVKEMIEEDVTQAEHFMLPPIVHGRGWRLFLSLPLIAERWEVQTKTPKEGWGNPDESFLQIQMYGMTFYNREGLQEGDIYLQGETFLTR